MAFKAKFGDVVTKELYWWDYHVPAGSSPIKRFWRVYAVYLQRQAPRSQTHQCLILGWTGDVYEAWKMHYAIGRRHWFTSRDRWQTPAEADVEWPPSPNSIIVQAEEGK